MTGHLPILALVALEIVLCVSGPASRSGDVHYRSVSAAYAALHWRMVAAMFVSAGCGGAAWAPARHESARELAAVHTR